MDSEIYYKHEPLHTTTHIRLLSLISSPGEPLICSIVASPRGAIAFFSLSYEWGSAVQMFRIQVIGPNGNDLGVIPLTGNLYHALCNLRDAPTIIFKTFWIDQICINQDDPIERASQVNQMGTVYKSASRVVSYLGPAGTSDQAGLLLLHRIHAQFCHLYDDGTLSENVGRFRRRYANKLLIPEKLNFTDDFVQEAWTSLGDFLFGPWTQRLWMLQEVCNQAIQFSVTTSNARNKDVSE
jgi:hypothetical protein